MKIIIICISLILPIITLADNNQDDFVRNSQYQQDLMRNQQMIDNDTVARANQQQADNMQND